MKIWLPTVITHLYNLQSLHTTYLTQTNTVTTHLPGRDAYMYMYRSVYNIGMTNLHPFPLKISNLFHAGNHTIAVVKGYEGYETISKALSRCVYLLIVDECARGCK